MKYIIMADGKGRRWHNYGGIPKHFAEVNGESIILHLIRLLKKYSPGSEIIVTSHDERYNFPGVRRHEPLHNQIELDRFTEELIEDDICFLYGDTWYSEKTIQMIIANQPGTALFFGAGKSIVAVKVKDASYFRRGIKQVRQACLEGASEKLISWQVYDSMERAGFIAVDPATQNINTPEEYFHLKKTEESEDRNKGE